MFSKISSIFEEPTKTVSINKQVSEHDKSQSSIYKNDGIPEDVTSTCLYKKPIKKPPLPTKSDVDRMFQPIQSKSKGRINAKELQEAFEIFQGRHFSDSVCKFVVRLFDLDKNGGLDVAEFEQLYFYIKEWVIAFNTFDRGKTGFLDETQFDYALKQMDVKFSPEFIKFLVTRYNPTNQKISLDQFIVICIQIQRFTDEFKERDINFVGNINLKYEDFLEMIMKCL